jgi:copper chaperone CopZ
MMKLNRLGPLGIAMIFAFLAIPEESTAQLLDVRQTVYGMDCAPCAYGLEKRMKRMDGVIEASVSLDSGVAHIVFELDHGSTLQSLRSAVSENGFSAEVATVRVSGKLSLSDDGWLLFAGDETFALSELPESGQIDSIVTLTGQVPRGQFPESDAWDLYVTTEQ